MQGSYNLWHLTQKEQNHRAKQKFVRLLHSEQEETVSWIPRCVHVRADRSIKSRKPSHTEWYLHLNSNDPKFQRSEVKTLQHSSTSWGMHQVRLTRDHQKHWTAGLLKHLTTVLTLQDFSTYHNSVDEREIREDIHIWHHLWTETEITISPHMTTCYHKTKVPHWGHIMASSLKVKKKMELELKLFLKFQKFV